MIKRFLLWLWDFRPGRARRRRWRQAAEMYMVARAMEWVFVHPEEFTAKVNQFSDSYTRMVRSLQESDSK